MRVSYADRGQRPGPAGGTHRQEQLACLALCTQHMATGPRLEHRVPDGTSGHECHPDPAEPLCRPSSMLVGAVFDVRMSMCVHATVADAAPAPI